MTKREYRVSVRGAIPPDIQERISQVHAQASELSKADAERLGELLADILASAWRNRQFDNPDGPIDEEARRLQRSVDLLNAEIERTIVDE